MRVGAFLLVVGAAVLCAASEPPEPPASLAPYVEDGEFDPGDFAYLKGHFADASDEEKAQLRDLLEWTTACTKPAGEEAVRELEARGFNPVEPQAIRIGPAICFQPAFIPQVPTDMTYAAFQQELARVRPIYESYLLAVRLAEASNTVPRDNFGRALEARTLAEQMVRHALSWGKGTTAGAPELTPAGRAILQARFGMETARHDRANTEWLKAEVAQRGWPRISDVGKAASESAWLLVQHADADPVFQLDVLRMMEPLVASGETSAQNYAYLYDRIMLKLTGKQRYATQMTCTDGEFVPQPLEDGIDVDANREEAGLSSLKEYQARMLDAYGRCGTPAGAG
jgi:hypothetical protein